MHEKKRGAKSEKKRRKDVEESTTKSVFFIIFYRMLPLCRLGQLFCVVFKTNTSLDTKD